MLKRYLTGPVAGAFGFLLAMITLLSFFLLFLPISLLKFFPRRSLQIWVTRRLVGIADAWIKSVNYLFDVCLGIHYDVQGFEGLNPEGRYLILGNHQAWADIFTLFYIYPDRISFPRFFMKRSLLWIPMIGYTCWVLDAPFMYRLTKAELKQRPELRGRDLEITRRACQKYRDIPVTVVNYMEGTRGTPAKRLARGSPYRHLLRPKTDSVEFMLNAMGDLFDGIIDLTVAYPPGVEPNFLNLLSGRVPAVKVRARVLPVPHELLQGDLRENLEMQRRFRAWVGELWARKDAEIEQLRREFATTTDNQGVTT